MFVCRPPKFSKANTGNILSKLRSIPEDKKSEIKKFLTLSDPNNTGLISYESFRYSHKKGGLNSSIPNQRLFSTFRNLFLGKKKTIRVGL